MPSYLDFLPITNSLTSRWPDQIEADKTNNLPGNSNAGRMSCFPLSCCCPCLCCQMLVSGDVLVLT